MALSTAFRNKVVDSIAANGGADWWSLHTADPGTTGANEVTGGSYARQLGAFPAASGGAAANAGVVFNVPAGVTVTHWSRWSASTAGTWQAGGALPGPQNYTVAGTYTLTGTVSQAA